MYVCPHFIQFLDGRRSPVLALKFQGTHLERLAPAVKEPDVVVEGNAARPARFGDEAVGDRSRMVSHRNA
jgi:hypothetical protein